MTSVKGRSRSSTCAFVWATFESQSELRAEKMQFCTKSWRWFSSRKSERKKNSFPCPYRKNRSATKEKNSLSASEEGNQTSMTHFIVITAFAHFFVFVNSVTGEMSIDEGEKKIRSPPPLNFPRGIKEHLLSAGVCKWASCFALEFLRFTVYSNCGKAFGFWNEMSRCTSTRRRQRLPTTVSRFAHHLGTLMLKSLEGIKKLSQKFFEIS